MVDSNSRRTKHDSTGKQASQESHTLEIRPKRDAAFDRQLEKDELRDLVARLRSGEKLTDKEKARAKKLLAEAWAGKLT